MADNMPDFSGVQSGTSTTANVKYRITAPDGHVLELEGPDGATDEEIAYVASQMYTPEPPKSPDTRTASRVGLDQLANTAKGALMTPVRAAQAAWGLGEGAGETVGKLIEGDPRGALARGSQLVSDTFHGVADPFYHAGQLTGEALVPGSQPADVMDPERLKHSAEAAGTNAVGVATQTAPAKQVMGAEINSGNLRNAASGMRRYAQENPALATLEQANVTTPVQAATTVPKAAASVVARPAAALVDRAADALASFESMRRAKEAAQMPVVPEMQAPVRQPRQIPAEPNAGFNAMERPDVAPPVEQMPTIPEPAPTVRQPAVQAPEVHNPAMFGEQKFAQYAPEDFSPDVPSNQPITPVDVTALQQAVNPAGAGAQTWLVRNAERVLDYAPELKGMPPGEEFVRKAIDAYNRADMEMHAAELSVPPDTVVPRTDLMNDLRAIQADYASRNLSTEVKQLEKVFTGLDKLPAGEPIPWQDFLKLKSGVWKDSSPALRRARGAFIKAAGQVAPAVNEASQNYSLMRRVLEGAKIDPLTRRPLKPLK